VNKVAHYLQEHLMAKSSPVPIRGLILQPMAVFCSWCLTRRLPPQRKRYAQTARFTWQLAERGRVIPITARGMGTDVGGAALGSGIVMVFRPTLHKILELDSKSGIVAVQPGTIFGKLQQTLHTHGRFCTVFPTLLNTTSIGGSSLITAAANAPASTASARDYVKGLRIVLANGELIETGRISKREAAKKMGLSSLEGEITGVSML